VSKVAIFEELLRHPHPFGRDRELVRNARAHELQKDRFVRDKVARTRTLDLGDRHALLIGGTRRGKSVLMELCARALIVAGGEGLSGIDPHGTFVRPIIEWLAHPASGQLQRIVHIIDPSAYAIGVNPLRPYDDSWEASHDAAITLASVIESRFEASAEETPRLARLIYVAGMLCARHGLTILELVEVLSLGAAELRRSLLQDFDNRVVRRELEDLCTLATKSPREFLNLVESTKNRLVRWLGDRRLVRMLGQKKGLDLRTVFDNRELVLADLGSLNYSDAALFGCIYTSMAFAVARRRPAMHSARHRIFLDEAESLITADVCRGADQSAKWGLSFFVSLQRLGQMRARGDFAADALLTNCAIWLILGGLEHESARYITENLYAGSDRVNFAEWIAGTERPTAISQVKVVLKNRTAQNSQSESTSRSDIFMRSSARAQAQSSASLLANGESFANGDTDAFAFTPPTPLLGASAPISNTVAHNSARASSTSRSQANAQSWSQQQAQTRGRSTARATTCSTALSEGQSEALATVYEDLPTQVHGLENQLFKLTGEVMNLPRRELIMRVEGQAPVHVRTIERIPAFRDAEYKALILPRYLKQAARRSGYAVANAEVDREIANRLEALTKPEPEEDVDFAAPEPPSIVDALKRAQNDFRSPRLPSETDEPPARGAPALRLLDGGKDGDKRP
jgi:hypothetical protein